MPQRIFIIAAFSILLVANFQAAFAQEKRLSSSPRAFQTFFSEFKKAVAKKDRARVAAMTKFPFKYGFDAGDEGTMSRTRFIKNFNRIFGDSPRRDFFPERNLLFSRGDGGSFVVSDENAAHYIFVKQGKSYKFTQILVEP